MDQANESNWRFAEFCLSGSYGSVSPAQEPGKISISFRHHLNKRTDSGHSQPDEYNQRSNEGPDKNRVDPLQDIGSGANQQINHKSLDNPSVQNLARHTHISFFLLALP
jgi:hypothetical protein